jgi:hypothetical protein
VFVRRLGGPWSGWCWQFLLATVALAPPFALRTHGEPLPNLLAALPVSAVLALLGAISANALALAWRGVPIFAGRQLRAQQREQLLREFRVDEHVMRTAFSAETAIGLSYLLVRAVTGG